MPRMSPGERAASTRALVVRLLEAYHELAAAEIVDRAREEACNTYPVAVRVALADLERARRVKRARRVPARTPHKGGRPLIRYRLVQ